LNSDDYAALLIDLYQRCNPQKVSEVPALLEQFRGREHELFEAVQSKYGMGAPAGTSAYATQQIDERRSIASHPAAPYLAEMRQYVGDEPRNDVSTETLPPSKTHCVIPLPSYCCTTWMLHASRVPIRPTGLCTTYRLRVTYSSPLRYGLCTFVLRTNLLTGC
jgi:hypothetical protein